MKGAELPAICPELATLPSVGIAVAKPLASAALTLPVAHLHLAIWTQACSGDLERGDLAVSVDTKFALVLDCELVVDISSAVAMIAGSNMECRRNADTVVVIDRQIGACYRKEISFHVDETSAEDSEGALDMNYSKTM